VGETMAQSMPHLERCVRHGCHVISLSEQVFHPWACDPELSTRIDALAKQHRVVVSASGMQDHLWLNLPLILSAGCHRITSIEGVSVVNADIFGPAVVKENGIGDLPSSIEKLQTSTPERANVFTYSLLSLAAALELNVVDWSQDLRPVVAPHRIKSDSLGRYIDPGQLQGCITGSRVRTRENIELIGDVVLKVFEPQETDLTRWTIKGSAELTAECPNTQAHIATGATVINRLPDVLTAPPGLQTVHALRAPRFRAQLSS
jgi:2,4-diaminopentanoate dehydrogenase